ncbi:MAG: hypothetical protein HY808_06925 [Nitrospirae bacterium]|nr:hypothetical protein [Nitrospirota bacterium]
MGKAAAVSLEGDKVKIVHASLRGKNITIDKTEVVEEREFDNYLRTAKASEFIVTCDFKEAFHDVITTPVVKEQYLSKIVESEIRKASARHDLVFIYTTIGEKVAGNKKVLEVFYFAVSKEALRQVVERFYDNGKTVRAVYPHVFSAASLFDSHLAGDAHMGIFGTGKARTIFFARKSQAPAARKTPIENPNSIYFIRNYESYETELSDFDIQNINMTISYCFQNIRLNPSAVYLMGGLAELPQISVTPTAPLTSLFRPEYINCSRETFNEYFLPVASFLAPGPSNILSQDFKNIYLLKSCMAYAVQIFVILAALCVGITFYEAKGAAEKKERINLSKKGRADIEAVFTAYSEREEKINQYMPVVEFLNRPSPDIKKLLISLAEIYFGDLTLNTVNAYAKEENTVSVTLQGKAAADTYAAMQDSLDNVTNELRKSENMEITNSSVDLKEKTFSIEMNYKTQ